MGAVILCMGVAVAAAVSIAVSDGSPFPLEGALPTQKMAVLDRQPLGNDDQSVAGSDPGHLQAHSN
jgi:hypothetical protein